jgi:hypothetical protein
MACPQRLRSPDNHAMGEEEDIGSLRSRVSELVGKESSLLDQAFALSRAGGDRRGVDALFAQVQAIQVERGRLKKLIGEVLGSRRLHLASEVWKPGVYDYSPADGGDTVRVRVASDALGLQVVSVRAKGPVRIEALQGTFDGPLAVDAPLPQDDDARKSKPKARTRKGAGRGPE